MTPQQEQAILNAVAAGLEAHLEAANRELIQRISAGEAPRDVVQSIAARFEGELATRMSEALTAIMGAAVGTTEVLALQVGGIALSRKLYAAAEVTGQVVQGIVQKHVAGFQDSRKLALELFEGYTFREPDAEPLKMAPSNPKLPRYMREALLSDDTLQGQMERAFARIQTNNLSTAALRAAYSQLLDSIDAMQAVAGKKLLEKRLEIAFFERMRYFANRIAQTELHRAYAQARAREMLGDTDLEYVEVRRSPGQQEPCICVLYTGRNAFGLGPGVYPKLRAPVPPYHPFCRCYLKPRLDLTGRKPQDEDEGADRYFLSRVGQPVAGRIMGSQAKAEKVLSGTPADTVYNQGKDPLYRVKRAAELTPP